MDIGTVKKTSIESNQDSAKKFIMLEVEESEGEDLQDVQLVSLSGIKSRPEPGERVYILNFGGGLKIGIAVEDNIETDKDEGERDFYSTLAGVRKAALTLKKDGTAVINDGSDFAALASKVDDFIAKIDAVIRTDWIPVANDGGAALQTAYLAKFVTAPGSVKSNTVKLP